MQIFKKSKNIIMSYVVITLGLMTYTFGWSAFMLPAQIVGGGPLLNEKLNRFQTVIDGRVEGGELKVAVHDVHHNRIVGSFTYKSRV